LLPRLNVFLSLFSVTSSGLLFGGIVGLSIRLGNTPLHALLGSRLLGAISKRSYAMYVFHLLPLYASFALLARAGHLPSNTAAALVLIALVGLVTYGMAWLSWRVLEEPVLRLKRWEWFARKSADVTLVSGGEPN